MSDARASAEAELREIYAAHNAERFNFSDEAMESSGGLALCDGNWVPQHKYLRRRLTALRQWVRKRASSLRAAGVEPVIIEDPLLPHVFLRDVEPDQQDDPWKPEPEAAPSSATELQRAAMYRPAPRDDRWTIASIAAEPEYRAKCREILESLTDAEKAAAAARLYDGLSLAQTAAKCGMANEQRVSEMIGRIRRRFTEAGLPAPRPPLPRQSPGCTGRNDDDDIDIDNDDGKPIRMLPADPAARRKIRRRAG